MRMDNSRQRASNPETQEAAKNQDDNKDDDDKGDSGSGDSAPKKGVSPMSFYVEKSESA